MNEKLLLVQEKNICKSLISLSLPNIIEFLIVSIYNFTDGLFVSGLGTEALGAISIIYPLIILIPGIGLLFGNSGYKITSKLLEANEKKKAEIVLSSTVFYGVIVSLIVEVLILVFLTPILKLIGATDTILPLAKGYSYILGFSFIFQALSICFANLLRVEDAINLSTCSQIVGLILNIILNPIFIYKIGLGINGSAIATVISQTVSFIILIYYYVCKKGDLILSIKNIRISNKLIKEIFSMGLPMYTINVFYCISLISLNIVAAPYGDEAIAAFGIVTRICSITIFVIMGFSKGYHRFILSNFRTRSLFDIEIGTKKFFRWSKFFCILVSIIQIVFSEQLIFLFTDDNLVASIGTKALFANSIVFFTYGYQALVIILLLSINKEIEGLLLSLGRQGIFFIPLAFIMPKLFGLTGIIYIQTGADILTTIVTLSIFFMDKNQLKHNTKVIIGNI